MFAFHVGIPSIVFLSQWTRLRKKFHAVLLVEGKTLHNVMLPTFLSSENGCHLPSFVRAEVMESTRRCSTVSGGDKLKVLSLHSMVAFTSTKSLCFVASESVHYKEFHHFDCDSSLSWCLQTPAGDVVVVKLCFENQNPLEYLEYDYINKDRQPSTSNQLMWEGQLHIRCDNLSTLDAIIDDSQNFVFALTSGCAWIKSKLL